MQNEMVERSVGKRVRTGFGTRSLQGFAGNAFGVDKVLVVGGTCGVG